MPDPQLPDRPITTSAIDIVKRQAPALADDQRAGVGVTNDNQGHIMIAGAVDIGHDVEAQGGVTKAPGSRWGWFANLIWKKK